MHTVKSYTWVAALACLTFAGCSKPTAPETRIPHDTTIQRQSGTTPVPMAVTPLPVQTAPKGYRAMTVGGVAPAPEGSAVVLVDSPGDIAVPIFIGGAEAMSIQLRLDGRPFKRPLTHDLVDSVLAGLGGQVVSVRVDRVEDDIFYGTLVLSENGQHVELDSRPSDAIALAVGASAPIFVAQSVIDSAGMRLDDLEDEEGEATDDFELPEDEITTVSL